VCERETRAVSEGLFMEQDYLWQQSNANCWLADNTKMNHPQILAPK
jgi:hypothetical protein